MREEVLSALQRHQTTLRQDWERRLRERPAVSALALPDLLIRLMDWTLESIWTEVKTGRSRGPKNHDWTVHCVCSANPLTSYFLCAKDTFVALCKKTPDAFPPMSPGEKKICAVELLRALDRVATQEIQTFCTVCQHRRVMKEDRPLDQRELNKPTLL